MQVPTLPHVFAFQSDVSLNACIASSLTTLPRKNQFFRPVVPRPFHGCFQGIEKNDRQKDPPLPKFRDIGFYQLSKSRSMYIYIERKSEVESIKLEKFEKFLIFCHIDMISAFNLLEIYIIVYVQSSSIKFQDIDNPGCG